MSDHLRGEAWIVCPDGSLIRSEDVRGVYVVHSFVERPWRVRLAVSHLLPGPPEQRGNYTFSQHETEAEARLQAAHLMHGVILVGRTCSQVSPEAPAETKANGDRSTKDPFSSPVPDSEEKQGEIVQGPGSGAGGKAIGIGLTLPPPRRPLPRPPPHRRPRPVRQKED